MDPIAELLPKPHEMLRIIARRRRCGFNFDSDNSPIGRLEQQVDFV